MGNLVDLLKKTLQRCTCRTGPLFFLHHHPQRSIGRQMCSCLGKKMKDDGLSSPHRRIGRNAVKADRFKRGDPFPFCRRDLHAVFLCVSTTECYSTAVDVDRVGLQTRKSLGYRHSDSSPSAAQIEKAAALGQGQALNEQARPEIDTTGGKRSPINPEAQPVPAQDSFYLLGMRSAGGMCGIVMFCDRLPCFRKERFSFEKRSLIALKSNPRKTT